MLPFFVMDTKEKLTTYLASYVTPSRLKLFEKILEWRTNYITVVLEDIYQPQNASAVLRTCDCFGIQNIHVIENRNTFTINKEVALGASKWLTINKYNKTKNNSLEAIHKLKKSGYRIVATTPHKNDQLLTDFNILEQKTAIVFGSELPGITDVLLNEADEFLKIPMYGFTESFNISVSASIILHFLTEKLRRKSATFWQLSDNEKKEIKLQWLRNTINKSEMLERDFYLKNKMKKN